MLTLNKDLLKSEIKKLTGIESLKENEFVINLLASDKIESGSAVIKTNDYSPSMYDLMVKVRLLSGTSINIRHVGFLDVSNAESLSTLRTVIKNANVILSAVL